MQFEALNDNWKAAATPNEVQPRALLALAIKRNMLPGAVAVRVPDGAMNDPAWAPVVAASNSMCGCGMRRLLTPTQGRSRFFADAPPRKVVVTKDSPLYVAPWAGDFESAYIRFSISGNELVGRLNPVGPQPTHKHELPGILTVRGPRPNEQEFGLYPMQNVIRTRGENICMQSIGNVFVPVCSIVEIKESDDDGNYTWSVTFELDATTIQVFPSGEPLHTCA